MASRPLKWHGGKHYLAQRIVALMPPHLVYVEPYFGGGAVLFARDPDRDWLIDDAWKLKHGDKVPAELRGCSEVVNDIHVELVNFWTVISQPPLFEMFHRRCATTPFSQLFWNATNLAREHQWTGDEKLSPEENRIQAALGFFVRYRQSRQGLGKDFATLSRNRTRRGMNEQASAWLSAVEGLPEAHERLKRVVILSDDALKVIRQQDGERTHFYLDPPYLHETRETTKDYEHEMTAGQHLELLEILIGLTGTFQLSGYRCEMYDLHAGEYGWHRVDFDLPNNASGRKQKERKTESLWMNYEPRGGQ